MDVLLVHLIKQSAEKRTTRSWTASIRNSVEAIYRTNKRRKAGGFYLTEEELTYAVDEIFDTALIHASLEAFGGAFSETELEERIDAAKIKQEALGLIFARQSAAAS
jgi:hypothetical protein